MAWITDLKPEWVAAISGAVSAIASLILAFLTFWLARLTAVLATETRASRKAATSADVQCSAQTHEHHLAILDMVIANVGAGVAREIRLTIKPRMGNGVDRPPLVLKLETLLPGTSFRTFLGATPSLLDRVITAEGSYVDAHGSHTISYSQAMSDLAGVSRVTEHPEYESADALTKIAETISRWTRHDRLKIDTFTADDREKEQQAIRHRMDQHEAELSATVAESPPEPHSPPDSGDFAG